MGGVVLMRKDALVTTETGWARLHRIAEARRRRLGLSQQGVQAAGGPSAAWLSKLKNEKGEPGTRRAAFLRRLDGALGWSDGTSISIVQDDRSTWSREMLDAEEHDLVEGVDDITRFTDAVALRLRALPPAEAQALMERLYRALMS
jgi:hypothetical protein